METLIRNGLVLTVNREFEIIENGFVGIENGRIAAIGAGEKPPPRADTVVDARGGIVMPGLVNAHTHLPMTLFRGLADDLPLADWLNQHIFPAEARHIHPTSAYYGAMTGCAELIRGGVSCICDGYFLENQVAQALLDAGLRGIAGQGVVDFPAPGVPDPGQNIDQAVRFMKTWTDRSPRISPSLFCHSPYTCSRDTLIRAKQAADKRGALFQIHVAETRAEIEQWREQHGVSPVRYLDELGILDANSLLVHAVWTDEPDIERIAKSGAGLVHCPESNMKLGSGIAPVPRFLSAGIPVALGTDGCASNNNLDMFGEMGMAARLHKVATGEPTVTNARAVVEMATISGARALGLESEIGSLEIGKSADILILDTRTPQLTPLYHPESHIAYAASGAHVRDLMVGGSFLLRQQRFQTLDWPDIRDKMAGIRHTIGKERHVN